MPDVEKSMIELEVDEQSICARAPREDMVYNACYTIAHAVDPSKTEAVFEEDLLKITTLLKSPIKAVLSRQSRRLSVSRSLWKSVLHFTLHLIIRFALLVSL